MKKIIIALVCVSFLGSSCSLFRKKEKYGCPSDGRNVGAEKIASGDEKAMKKSKKAKFRG
ncbi:hypothetical protein ACQ33O_05550 [Ferruginibacter sp. SUN002]|uniref:hypothetical protein n=1 Tax=Ferruginibacter sp. SUN002 TaxID=2937789 RepID=UPI003D35ACBF